MWQLLTTLEQCGQMSQSAMGLLDIWKKFVMLFIRDDRLIYRYINQMFMCLFHEEYIDIRK